MRAAHLLTILAPSLTSLALARSNEQIQIFLHPSPPSPHAQATDSHDAVPTLTADQAKAVLTHHMGDPISDFEEIPADEGMWSHLMGMWGGGLGHGKEVDGGRVVIVDGGVSPQDVLPTTIPSQPSFYMDSNTDSTNLLEPYFQKAKTFFDAVIEHLPDYVKDFVDEFEIAGTHAAAALQKELSALIALSEKSLVSFLKNLKQSTWEAVRISGLVDVEEGSKEWEAGTKNVQAGLESMSQPDSPPLLVIIMPQTQSQTHFHTSAKRQVGNIAPRITRCYADQDACNDGTNCFGNGKCALLRKTGEGECWGCKCANGYAGVECQKVDYSVPFMLIAFSSLFLIVLVVGSIALLSSIGNTKLPSTLTLAVGGQSKRD